MKIKKFLEEDSVKYPKLTTYLSDGEPRFELHKKGDKVDTIRVGRYDLQALRKLLKDLGLQRDESYTWERKKAEYDLERAFKEASFNPLTHKEESDEGQQEALKQEL